ncbi:hypothetical protein AB2M62_10410 [Sphingomonas sp. MMS12-HWE2-04]|uniref:hypothetical protein n=1 Tax=Sphingomonas sp. MMS12-HWE2-04 TaxID=3234199 RepID=UPI00384A7762
MIAAHSRRVARGICACLLASAAAPAWAQNGPEQLEQIEPDKGEWQLEYFGAFGGSGEQAVEASYAVSDRIVLGAQVEVEGPRGGLTVESAGLGALVRLIEPTEAPIGLGLQFEVSVDRDGRIAELEGRGIAETRTPKWWLQADLILRRVREDRAQATGLAYATSIQRGLGEDLWAGIEASGQIARLSGEDEAAPAGQHYLGPSLTIERPIGRGAEVELGFAWLQRVRGRGPGSGPRIFAQFVF